MTAFDRHLLTGLSDIRFWRCEWPRFGPQTDGRAGSVSNGKRSHLARGVSGGAARGLEKIEAQSGSIFTNLIWVNTCKHILIEIYGKIINYTLVASCGMLWHCWPLACV